MIGGINCERTMLRLRKKGSSMEMRAKTEGLVLLPNWVAMQSKGKIVHGCLMRH